MPVRPWRRRKRGLFNEAPGRRQAEACHTLARPALRLVSVVDSAFSPVGYS